MLLKIRISLVLAMLGSFCLCPVLASGVSATVSGSSACVYRQPSDSSRCIRVRKGTKVTVKDVRGGWAKVSRKGLVGYIRVSALSRSKASKRASWKKKVVVMEWFNGGDGVMKEGHYGYVYDIRSGQVIKVKRLGGHNHMDLEPARRSDGVKMKKIGASWHPRPAILRVGGKYIACSINTKPHGNQTVKGNGFNGQFCLHMAGSKTHGGEVVRGDHQSAIEKAYKWAHK